MISRGEGALGTVYEKLRKRSYRRSRLWGRYLSTTPLEWQPPSPPPRWMPSQHEAYVQGVRDALKDAGAVVLDLALQVMDPDPTFDEEG